MSFTDHSSENDGGERIAAHSGRSSIDDEVLGCRMKRVVNKRPGEITKRDLVQLVPDQYGSYEKIEEWLASGGGPYGEPLPPQDGVKLKHLFVAKEGVFQHRLYGRENIFESQENTLILAKALLETNEPLEPLLVFPVISRFYIMDGHHRLAAYKAVKWSKPIPVEIFKGTLAEARIEALRRNSRNKLSMTNREKSEAAWRLVKAECYSRPEIKAAAGVSISNVRDMKAVWEQLKDAKAQRKLNVSPHEFTWAKARLWKQRRGTLEDDEEWSAKEWQERKAEELVALLEKHNITAALRKDPEITAMALAKLMPNTTARLAELWTNDWEEEDWDEVGSNLAEPLNRADT